MGVDERCTIESTHKGCGACKWISFGKCQITHEIWWFSAKLQIDRELKAKQNLSTSTISISEKFNKYLNFISRESIIIFICIHLLILLQLKSAKDWHDHIGSWHLNNEPAHFQFSMLIECWYNGLHFNTCIANCYYWLVGSVVLFLPFIKLRYAATVLLYENRWSTRKTISFISLCENRIELTMHKCIIKCDIKCIYFVMHVNRLRASNNECVFFSRTETAKLLLFGVVASLCSRVSFAMKFTDTHARKL